jgi:hypothetical protein
MGVKTWMLVGSTGDASEILKSKPKLDREASQALAVKLFPAAKLEPIADGNLSYTSPRDGDIYLGCFPGLSIVAAEEFAIDRPSQLPAVFLDAALGSTIHLHAMHSGVGWFAFGVWQDGRLRRSLSLSPDEGLLEDIGEPLPFELPFWNGQRNDEVPEAEGLEFEANIQPVVAADEDEDAPPFAFNPLEMGEEALLTFFGYQIEGGVQAPPVDAEQIVLLSFRRPQGDRPASPLSPAPAKDAKPWWRFW